MSIRASTRLRFPSLRAFLGRRVAIAAACLTFWVGAVGVPAHAAEEVTAVYQVEIRATYDPNSRLLRGTELLRWRNPARVSTNELRFHLYLNAFSHPDTTFFRGPGRRAPRDLAENDTWGWIEVKTIRTQDGVDLKAGEEFLSPDDGNENDRTVVRYPLPEPLPPGGLIAVEIEFEAKLPDIVARTGAAGDFVLGGQWFPKIGVFEDAGMRGRETAGWNVHQFHGTTEFYADFGDYDVSLTLPERYRGRIGATGDLQSETVEGGQVTARFRQKGVHDFAWTADPDYRILEERFDPMSAVSEAEVAAVAELLGVDPGELRLQPVDLRLLLQPENGEVAERYLRAARQSIVYMGLYLGPYPYDTLTLVDPAADAPGASGMEYPTFITLGTSGLEWLPPLDFVRVPEVVTAHEFAHQYFQGLVASNEFEESWLDEGITSFYEQRILEERLDSPLIDFLGLRLSSAALARFDPDRDAYADPVVTPAWEYRNGGSWGANSYSRPSLILRHLEGLVGPQAFARAMRAYFREWRFRHPSTADFEASIETSLGEDLSWFFDQALHSTAELDYGVTRLRTETLEDEEESDEAGAIRYRSRVEVRRLGEFVHPVTLEVRFDDGGVERREWEGAERWRRWTFEGPARVVDARIDPDDLWALDTNRLNDGLAREADPAPRMAISSRVAFWLQNLFHLISLLG